jgi:single-strand DNA-binding protein
MIKLQVIGNLGRDATLNSPNGKNVINFSVAHSEKYKDAQGNQQDRTIWVECAYWTDRTNLQPYLIKGKTVYVEGTPSVESYTTADGRQGIKLKLTVKDVQFVGGNRTEGTNTGAQAMSGHTPNTGAPMAAAPSIETASAPFSNNDMSASLNDDLPF